MATTTDLLFRPALDLAALVRSGELAARELVAASLERIDAVNPELNAFVDVFHDEALAAAGAIHPGDERPFAGVPIAVKNNRAIEGRRLTFGSDFAGDWTAPYDHNVVRRLRAAGFVIVGSTTLPEWGILPWTDAKRFGATRNPWDPARTSGGSSGGSATAVAAGLVPNAPAHDGGGPPRLAHPGRVLRLRGLQAAAQPRLARARDRPELPRHRRRPEPNRRRHGRRARRAGRARGRRRSLGAAAAAPGPLARVAGPGGGGGPPAVAPAPPRRAVHGAVRAARDGPGGRGGGHRRPRAGRGRHGAAEPGAVAPRRRHVRARGPGRNRPARAVRPRAAGVDGALQRRRGAGAGGGAGPARHRPLGHRRPDGPLHALGRVHAVHGRGERVGPAGDLRAAVRARGPAGRRAALRRAPARGRPAPRPGPARGGPAVGRPPPARPLTRPSTAPGGAKPLAYASAHGLRDRGAVHRDQGQLLRRGVPGGLHPPDAGRARLRRGRAALHRPRG